MSPTLATSPTPGVFAGPTPVVASATVITPEMFQLPAPPPKPSPAPPTPMITTTIPPTPTPGVFAGST